ncbi:MAG: tetratricopeptide repeat protein [Betaproteobacteria bacterium]
MGLPVQKLIHGAAIAASLLGLAQAQPFASAPAPRPAFVDQESSPLTPSRMFQVLAADVAVQRGEYEVAAKIYLELATNLKDARLARRAAQAATLARQPAMVLEAAKTWASLEPDSVQARNTLAAVLVSQGPLSESKQFLAKWIADAADQAEVFRNLNRVLASQKNRREVFDVMREVAAPYDTYEAHLAIAQAALGTDAKEKAVVQPALVAIDRALQLKPGADQAGGLKAELLLRGDSQQAIKFLTEFGTQYPNAHDARYLLARILLSENKPRQARDALVPLVSTWPEDVSMQYVLALANYETKDYAAAEQVLLKLLEQDDADQDRVLTLLGQVNEEQKRLPDALARYRAVDEGDLWFGAQQRIALVLGKMGSVAEARQHLRSVKASPAQKMQLALTEGNLLRDAGMHKEAFESLQTASGANPESGELLYDLAMAAEKIDRFDVAESALKRVIALKPDDAQGYNALGYTLVDRTDRIEEGLKLIEKALALSPEDAFILDSMGWGYYRLGQYSKSVEYLRRALERRADPEVAAHLGEVLWKMGDQAAADKVWRDALNEAPTHPVLTETVKRFTK